MSLATTNEESIALLAILAGAVLIGFAPLLVRVSELPPIATAFYRMLLALPFFVAWSFVSGWSLKLPKLSKPARWSLLFSGIFFAADLSVWHWSIHLTSIANATLMANLAPVFVVVLGFFFLKERVTRLFLLGLVCAIVGAFFLVRGGVDAGTGTLGGDILGGITALFYAGYLLCVRVIRQKLDTFRVMFYSSATTALLLGVLVLVSGESLVPSTMEGWVKLLLLALLPQVLGQSLIAYGLAHLPAAYSSVSLLVQPVTSAILAWTILAEPMGMVQLLGGFVVLVSIFLCHQSRSSTR